MLTITYAEQMTKKGPRSLQADLYFPGGKDSFPLIVWMHSGGFRGGSRTHRAHKKIAAEFGRHGYGMAFIDYRLARPVPVLGPKVEAQVADLIAEAGRSREEMNETFVGHRPLAVVEDCCAFLNHAVVAAPDWQLNGRFLLGGSSAGAISALNTLYLPRRLGLERPPIETVFAFSGGFAYSESLWETGARIMALHNPADDRVPISSIRRFAQAGMDDFLLIESDAQLHGSMTLDPKETLSIAVARCVAFDQAEDPISLQVEPVS